MPPIQIEEHLAELARYHGVEFDEEDLRAFEQVFNQGAGPAEMEDFVGRYVADVYESGVDDDADDDVDDEVNVDDETNLDEQRADTEQLIGRLELATQTLGRRLTRDEATRIAVALDKTEWTGDIERVLSEANVKDFSSMNNDEERDWIAGRIDAHQSDEPDPEPPPMTETGKVDYDAMSRNDQAEYMARRVEAMSRAELQASGE